MNFNKRYYFKNIANETLDIIDKGYYINHNSLNTISVVNNTTVDTIIDLRKKGISGNIIALNFASAKNPGGGFQTGANVQEESISRVSALYPCLIRCKEFYEYHKKHGNIFNSLNQTMKLTNNNLKLQIKF
ncbi:TIGR02452 family protein [Clostridium sp. P21]|uniref:TIGR02452 family protein n=1 Tax=Clostridium muellerianum TaxID=2716538 RepID=A0A7Y0EHG5_9CLOT|nr:TIGR02452 family protein [Clostridium muellerianum]NMM63549.1 TIGR02452 family protein [Clostridium muellerianum]